MQGFNSIILSATLFLFLGNIGFKNAAEASKITTSSQPRGKGAISASDLSSVKSYAPDSKGQVNVIFQKEMKSPNPIANVITAELVFPPGDVGSPPHTHPGPVIGYVIEGQFLFQVNNETPRIIKAGGTFSENDGVVHVWSGNASNNTTCRVIATVWGRPGEPLLTLAQNYPRESMEEALKKAKQNAN